MKKDADNFRLSRPDRSGHFGHFGGRYVPETLIPALEELTRAWRKIIPSREFQEEFKDYLSRYAGRPTPLYFARRLTEHFRGAKIYLKREDLAHTGSHKINNTLGQVLLARRLGKTRIIAETGAGQHGVATATAAALFGLPCRVYMGATDIERQRLNVYRMRLLGSEVVPVSSGSATLKDAINACLRDWVTNVRDTFYVLGSVVGPHPYPAMVRDFQRVIGEEVRRQIIQQEEKLPDVLLACVGGGSNSLGLFAPFFRDKTVRFIGVEAGGYGLRSGKHSATLVAGREGILHGARSLILQDKNGQILPTHSVAAGLDYPGVGPEHSFYKEIKRAEYFAVTDRQAKEAFHLLSEQEGIIPALESAHALAFLPRIASRLKKTEIIVVGLSGRGDKDVDNLMS